MGIPELVFQILPMVGKPMKPPLLSEASFSMFRSFTLPVSQNEKGDWFVTHSMDFDPSLGYSTSRDKPDGSDVNPLTASGNKRWLLGI